LTGHGVIEALGQRPCWNAELRKTAQLPGSHLRFWKCAGTQMKAQNGCAGMGLRTLCF
jgi:hypothetical protein